MKQSSWIWIRVLFVLIAVYDGVLGIVFTIAPKWAFEFVNVTEPNHFGYVQFPAALLIVFAAMFVAIACQPVRNRNLIPYGIGLKVSYCAVIFIYWCASTGLPDLWKPFAVVDAVTVLLFVWAYAALGRTPT
ncbi:MAG: hypothetical protein KAS72_10565 [Phycisphaerales bacterium]|nr:hypothetical protein [Phycisphaerales bacterium]